MMERAGAVCPPWAFQAGLNTTTSMNIVIITNYKTFIAVTNKNADFVTYNNMNIVIITSGKTIIIAANYHLP